MLKKITCTLLMLLATPSFAQEFHFLPLEISNEYSDIYGLLIAGFAFFVGIWAFIALFNENDYDS